METNNSSKTIPFGSFTRKGFTQSFFCECCFNTAVTNSSISFDGDVTCSNDMDISPIFSNPNIDIYCRKCDNYMVEVDTGIIEHVVRLNKAGCFTLFSREGHINRPTAKAIVSEDDGDVYENPYIAVVLNKKNAEIIKKTFEDFYAELNRLSNPVKFSKYDMYPMVNIYDIKLEDGEEIYRIGMDLLTDCMPSENEFEDCRRTWLTCLMKAIKAIEDDEKENKRYTVGDIIDLFENKYGFDNVECDEGDYKTERGSSLKLEVPISQSSDIIASIIEFCNIKSYHIMDMNPITSGDNYASSIIVRVHMPTTVFDTEEGFLNQEREFFNSMYKFFYEKWEKNYKSPYEVKGVNYDVEAINTPNDIFGKSVNMLKDKGYTIDQEYGIIKHDITGFFTTNPAITITGNTNKYTEILSILDRHRLNTTYKTKTFISTSNKKTSSNEFATRITINQSFNVFTIEEVKQIRENFWKAIEFIAIEISQNIESSKIESNKYDGLFIKYFGENSIIKEIKKHSGENNIIREIKNDEFPAAIFNSLAHSAFYDVSTQLVRLFGETNNSKTKFVVMNFNIGISDENTVTNPILSVYVKDDESLYNRINSLVKGYNMRLVKVAMYGGFKASTMKISLGEDYELMSYLREIDVDDNSIIYRIKTALFWAEVDEILKNIENLDD